MSRNKQIFSILVAVGLLTSIVIIVPDVYGLKSKGIKASIINSQEICGDKLCSEPQTIEEKIEEYLYKLFQENPSLIPQGRFQIGGPGGLFQQGITESPIDQDGDTIPDEIDNCPSIFNYLQRDYDGNGIGFYCDTDSDGDTVPDEFDNCDNVPNLDQKNSDFNEMGDACEPDTDTDGVPDFKDNCPEIKNSAQEDYNANGIGTACEENERPNEIPNFSFTEVSVYSDSSVQIDSWNYGFKNKLNLEKGGVYEPDDSAYPSSTITPDRNMLYLKDGKLCQMLFDLEYQKDTPYNLEVEVGWNNKMDQLPGYVIELGTGNQVLATINGPQPTKGTIVTNTVTHLSPSPDFWPIELMQICLEISNPQGINQVDFDNIRLQTATPGSIDSDGDGIGNSIDNCPNNPNPGQENSDGHGAGDVCDNDSDNDGISNDQDNCPDFAFFLNDDYDNDGLGDVCDLCPADYEQPDASGEYDGCPDSETDTVCYIESNLVQLPLRDLDCDEIPDAIDSCQEIPEIFNGFEDQDGCPDEVPEPESPVVEEPDFHPTPDSEPLVIDSDGDGHEDFEDNCPMTPNPHQQDYDENGIGDACEADYDEDGVFNNFDNCQWIHNPEQSDSDQDGIGDFCEVIGDDDGDGRMDSDDNCPNMFNRGWEDSDGDGIGDACDRDFAGDYDQDEVLDPFDNCKWIPNRDQLDSNGDGQGDVCQDDKDADGILDDVDNCPLYQNNDQADSNFDGMGDICDVDNDGIHNAHDNCVYAYNPDQEPHEDFPQIGEACLDDRDGDGVKDGDDNCISIFNPDQEDLDGNLMGDVCDDLDNDGVRNSYDNCPDDYNPDQKDKDYDGKGDLCDGDVDNDTILNEEDNCPQTSNSDQSDFDNDGVGDPCDNDYDTDGDTIPDHRDNCPQSQNSDQKDIDSDGFGDRCDPTDDRDLDNDGIPDSQSPQGLPTAPMNFRVVYGGSEHSFYWNAPVNSGNSPITGYIIEVDFDKNGNYLTVLTDLPEVIYTGEFYFSVDMVECIGAPYCNFRITAVNDNGQSPYATSEVIGSQSLCLIATASYGSILADEVQMLREIRDNHLLQTQSGAAFMSSFNTFYYSFAPTVAQWEYENPAFKEFVKLSITPLISSLSLLQFVEMNSEVEVLVYGISMILLNIGMYFVAPVMLFWGVKKQYTKKNKSKI